MLKSLLILLICFALFAVSGCAMKFTPVSNINTIKDVDFTKEMKIGESCGTYILGLGPISGDTSIITAAKNSGIKKIEVVDYKFADYIIIQKSCVIIYGE
jgi:NAD-dependent DNA ligase